MYLVSLHGHATSCRPGASGAPTECSALTHGSAVVDQLQRLGAHPGHDLHGGDDVFGVGDLDAELRILGVVGAHAERHDVHRPAAHAPGVQTRSGSPSSAVGSIQLLVAPASGRIDRADEGAVLDPSDVGGVGRWPERVRLCRQPGESSRRDKLVGQRSHSAAEPSVKTTSSGRVSSATSMTQDSSPGLSPDGAPTILISAGTGFCQPVGLSLLLARRRPVSLSPSPGVEHTEADDARQRVGARHHPRHQPAASEVLQPRIVGGRNIEPASRGAAAINVDGPDRVTTHSP